MKVKHGLTQGTLCVRWGRHATVIQLKLASSQIGKVVSAAAQMKLKLKM